MLVALYLSTFINVCYCFIHIRGELFDLSRFIYADCDCLLLLILFYWLFVIYVVRVYIKL